MKIGSPSWNTAVFNDVVAGVRERRGGDWSEGTSVHAIWLSGHYLSIVYHKRGTTTPLGFCHDLREAATISPPDLKTLGMEIMYYQVWEPHEVPPPDWADPDVIYWRGWMDGVTVDRVSEIAVALPAMDASWIT
ncbi:hypothetical protein [Rhodococcus jostii]|uniref:hypothetical protein n=1 Tax=Rhodococcus jostii TaxID=132919 RepID=UPI00362C80A8